MNNKNLSKFLSLVLRHKPEVIALQLDNNGWADVEELLQKMRGSGKNVDIDRLKVIVDTDNKQRYSFSEDFQKIRANQGHSVSIDLGLEPQTPPAFLFHGTASRFIDSIKQTGLKSQSRQHVHLSSDLETATIVGRRHGKPVILKIDSGKMFANGIHFYRSENGVWLTEKVSIEYISFE